MSRIIRLVDRSRTTCDWGCARKRWYQYELDGKGVVPSTQALELFLGTTLHDGLSTIATHQRESGEVDIDAIATVAAATVREGLLARTSGEVDEVNFAFEQGALVEGLLRGFHAHAWPRLLAEYPVIVAIEQEMTYDLDAAIRFMSRPDLILATRDGEDWCYVEYKSTSSKKVEWVESWETAVQVHSTIKAVEATLGKAPSSVIVQGLYKGYVSYGRQNNPVCYAYARGGNPPFTAGDTRYDYASGYKRTPTWDMPGGVKAWVAGMPEAILTDLFLRTPPLLIKDDLVMSFFSQRLSREHEILLAHQLLEGADPEITTAILDTTFPQKFDQCRPAWGRGCEYRLLCHSGITDPLSHGFQWRVPHHAAEVEAFSDVETRSTQQDINLVSGLSS